VRQREVGDNALLIRAVSANHLSTLAHARAGLKDNVVVSDHDCFGLAGCCGFFIIVCQLVVSLFA
jgi:hypothetical protein